MRVGMLLPDSSSLSDAMTDDLSTRRYNARIGLALFSLYLAFYLGFVLINAFRAEWMERVVFAGLNLAVVYGFALIGVAVVLAFIYGISCQHGTAQPGSAETARPESDAEDRR